MEHVSQAVKNNTHKWWVPQKNTPSKSFDLNAAFTATKIIPDNPISQFSSFDLENVAKLKKKYTKSMKQQIFPTKEQADILRGFIGAYRYFYNRTVHYLNNRNSYGEQPVKYYWKYNKKKEKHEKKRKSRTNLNTIRKILKGNNAVKWSQDIPSHLIDQAIKEACDNYSTCMKKYNKTGEHFELKYKSKKKSITETINIEANALNKYGTAFYPKSFGKDPFIEGFKVKRRGFKIVYDRVLRSWYVLTSHDIPHQKYRDHKHEVIALDPGEAIFQTGYSEDHGIMIGQNCRKVIGKVAKQISIIQSRYDQCTDHKKKQGLKKALRRRRIKIRNLKNDLHWKTAKYLAMNYKNILIPVFETQKMVKTLNHSTSRSLMNLAHYTFRIRLIEQCQKYNTNLYVVTEEFTSKTCTACGEVGTLKETSYRTYCCTSCDCEIDRDCNGSRNILLKYLE